MITSRLRWIVPGAILLISFQSYSQDDKGITVRSKLLNGSVYMLDCVGDFGGGNVAASVGTDGILLVDAMYKMMNTKLTQSLQSLSVKPVRMVINSHFHADHIEGTELFSESAAVIAHENLALRLSKASPPKLYPMITFRDSINIRFNGEKIRIIHVADCHTDNDVIVFFEKSKILHLGDLFFNGMFPAVYKAGGGNIRQLAISLKKIHASFPADTKVIPGHGDSASMTDLQNYINMLTETIALVDGGIKKNRSLREIQDDPSLMKYKNLSEGGAQTTPQYIEMLFKLLQ